MSGDEQIREHRRKLNKYWGEQIGKIPDSLRTTDLFDFSKDPLDKFDFRNKKTSEPIYFDCFIFDLFRKIRDIFYSILIKIYILIFLGLIIFKVSTILLNKVLLYFNLYDKFYTLDFIDNIMKFFEKII